MREQASSLEQLSSLYQSDLAAIASLRDVTRLPATPATDVATRSLGTRGNADFFEIRFTPDSVTEVKDSAGATGVLLTGTKIIDYARLLKLRPEYEGQIENYKAQSRLQDQLIDKLQAQIEIKNAQVENLQLQKETERERADIYKTMAEVNKEGFFDKFMRRAALPIGLVVGLVVGAAVN